MDTFTPPTQPGTHSLPPSAAAFQSYVIQHQLSLLDVALAARVRYLTVWRIAHALPVQGRHAALVRAGLQRLTGVPYIASIALLTSLPEQQLHSRERSADAKNV